MSPKTTPTLPSVSAPKPAWAEVSSESAAPLPVAGLSAAWVIAGFSYCTATDRLVAPLLPRGTPNLPAVGSEGIAANHRYRERPAYGFISGGTGGCSRIRVMVTRRLAAI